MISWCRVQNNPHIPLRAPVRRSKGLLPYGWHLLLRANFEALKSAYRIAHNSRANSGRAHSGMHRSHGRSEGQFWGTEIIQGTILDGTQEGLPIFLERPRIVSKATEMAGVHNPLGLVLKRLRSSHSDSGDSARARRTEGLRGNGDHLTITELPDHPNSGHHPESSTILEFPENQYTVQYSGTQPPLTGVNLDTIQLKVSYPDITPKNQKWYS